MKTFLNFIKNLIKQFNENELIFMSNELTYKMLLAIFPLLIYLINILTFFGVKYQILESSFVSALPDAVIIVLSSFMNSITTVAESNNIKSIMNLSLILTIWSSSSGFGSVMRGINKTYGVKDERGFIHQKLISIYLVLQFTATLLISSVFMVFNDVLTLLLDNLGIIIHLPTILNILSYIMPTLIILINIMLVYKISSFKKIRIISTLPGAVVTVIAWIITSVGYNFYINNFSKYNAVYGVIGSFIIFILWINIIAIVLLIGSQINALLEDKFVIKK